MGFYSQAFLVFLMKESKRRRRKQLGKLMAKSCSQPVNLPGARPLMNLLNYMYLEGIMQNSVENTEKCIFWQNFSKQLMHAHVYLI